MSGLLSGAGVLPAKPDVLSSLSLPSAVDTAYSSSLRNQLAAPLRRLPAHEEQNLPTSGKDPSQNRPWNTHLRSEPKALRTNGTRQEAMEQNLIFRIMFTEEPRGLAERIGSQRHPRPQFKSAASTPMLAAADPAIKRVRASYGGVTKRIQLHQGCCDEMAEQLVRQAFDLCPERVICLRDMETGAVTAAKTQMAEGVYEVITDEDQDVAGHLPVQSLHSQITCTASKAVVKDALKHCGLAHILPELKHMSGAKLLSMPLEALQDIYAMSGWRLRAVRSLYRALHPPVRISIDDSESGEGAVTAQVASAKEFSELLAAHRCAALRACGSRGNGHLAIRFEELRQGHVYSPERVSDKPFEWVGAAL